MNTKKTYKLSHWDTDARIHVEIDIDFKVEKHKISQEEAIKEMVEFWGGWKYRLKKNKGNYTVTLIKQIAEYSFMEGFKNNWDEDEIVDYWSKWNEGFYPLPEIGINITWFDCPEVDWEDILIEDITDDLADEC